MSDIRITNVSTGETLAEPAEPDGPRYRIMEEDTWTGYTRHWWVAGQSLTEAQADLALEKIKHTAIVPRYRYFKERLS